MEVYKTKTEQLRGTSRSEIKGKSLEIYFKIKQKSKRKPYVRSAYFKKEKIFLDLFWAHVFEKNFWDQTRRMKFFGCAIELIRKSRCQPLNKKNPNKSAEVLYRFYGETPDGAVFYVQIKEHTRKRQKFLISVFPEQK